MRRPEALCLAVVQALRGAPGFMYYACAERFADNQHYRMSAGYTPPHRGKY